MSKIYFYLLVVCIMTITCKEERKHDEIIINPENVIEKEFLLSDFAEETMYIPLDNQVIFKGIGVRSFEVINNFFAVGTNDEGFLVYDMKGNYINRIGRKGRGPGEYQFTSYFTVDSQSELIYIYDFHKIITYTIKGDFIREFSMDEYDDRFSSILYHNGNLFLAGNINLGYAKYDWIIIDTLGNLNSYKLNTIPQFETNLYGNSGFIKSDSIFYWNEYNDTIFQLYNNSYKPAMYFARGNLRKPHSRINREDLSQYFIPNLFFKSKDHLFFSYFLYGKRYLTLINKRSGYLELINKGTNIMIGYLAGIINDLDGGPDFFPFYHFEENGEEFLITWFFAYQLIAHIKSDKFRDSTPIFPEMKYQLEKLAASLDENDNQVLMIVRLK